MTGPTVNTLPMTFVGRPDGAEDLRPAVIPFPSRVPEITKAASLGNEAAAREFFETYCDRLFRYLVVLSHGDEESARETLSNAMIKAIRKMQRMETDEDCWRWLTIIARHCYVDLCRKQKRRIITDDMPETLATPQPDNILIQALNEAVSELPATERDIVERYYFDDTSQLNLAAEENISRKAVESRLARIRKKLRAAILKKLS